MQRRASRSTTRGTRGHPSRRAQGRAPPAITAKSLSRDEVRRVPSPALRIAGTHGEPAYFRRRYFLGGIVENDALHIIANVPAVKHVGDVRQRHHPEAPGIGGK